MRFKENLHKLPRRFALTLHMKISKLILLASLLVATEAAQAGKPVLGTVIESDHILPLGDAKNQRFRVGGERRRD
jgi:hypothetical protein